MHTNRFNEIDFLRDPASIMVANFTQTYREHVDEPGLIVAVAPEHTQSIDRFNHNNSNLFFTLNGFAICKNPKAHSRHDRPINIIAPMATATHSMDQDTTISPQNTTMEFITQIHHLSISYVDGYHRSLFDELKFMHSFSC